MGKILIANALDFYRGEDELTLQEANARQTYHLRYLWLMDQSDILVLPKMPARDFLSYFAGMQGMRVDDICIVTFEHLFTAAAGKVCADPVFLKRLHDKMQTSKNWRIRTCYLHRHLAALADHLNIPLHPDARAWAREDTFRRVNSKEFFRHAAMAHRIPVPDGVICTSAADLAEGMLRLINQTGMLIMKQEYNGGGRGNIGVVLNQSLQLKGVARTLKIENMADIPQIASEQWNTLAASHQNMILEVYHPNTGSFTIQFYIPEIPLSPVMLYHAEIRMLSSWLGVQIPAPALSAEQVGDLTRHALCLARLLQKKGYQGYLCCDAIRLQDGSIVFTEINARPGAESSAHYFAMRHFGQDYDSRLTLLTRRHVKLSSFENTLDTLRSLGLLYKPGKKQGVVILLADGMHGEVAECLFVARDPASAAAIEEKTLSSIC